MSTPETTNPTWGALSTGQKAVWVIGLVVAALLIIGALSDAGTDAGPSTSQVEATAACQHFRNVAGDAAAGVLTDAELREKFKQIESSALGSSVHDEARGLLAAATSGTLDASDVRAMGHACEAVGR